MKGRTDLNKLLVTGIILSMVGLTGCIGEQPPSDYPGEISGECIDVRFFYDEPVFYFGDAVQDNGSVNVSKTVSWTLTIENHGEYYEDVRFRFEYFPRELMMWSTTIAYSGIGDTSPEYDYEDEIFDRHTMKDLPPGAQVVFTVSITFNKTISWTYSPDTNYFGLFEISRRIYDGHNVFFDELLVPMVVRT